MCGLVTASLGRDPLSGEVFVFTGRRRTHIKLLVWDRSGFVLYYKHLEEGTFEMPTAPQAGPLSWQHLVLMLEGVLLKSARYRKRYTYPIQARRGVYAYLASMEGIVDIEAYEALRAENQALREALQLAQEDLQLARQETALAQERLARLEDELAGLKRLLFGTKSRRFVPSSRAGGGRRAASTKQQTSAAPDERVSQGVEASPPLLSWV